jgi:hypothetical protein
MSYFKNIQNNVIAVMKEILNYGASTVFIDMVEMMDCLRKVTIRMFKDNSGR